MKIQALLTIEIRDAAGQLKSFEKREANSFLRSLIDQLYCQATQAAFTGGGIDTGGVTRNIGAIVTAYDMRAALGVVTNGIVLGTGTNAVTVGDYALQTLIGHGSSGGLLYYNAVTFPSAPATVGGTRSFSVQRIVNNNSGNSITVNEVAIYVPSSVGSGLCIDRTLNTKAIPNGSTGTYKYTIGVTV